MVTNFGPDVLYRNRGDGTFLPVRFIEGGGTAETGLAAGETVVTGNE